MNKDDVIKKLEIIFCDVFDLNSIELSDKTSADDIDHWDSLNHVLLVSAIQKEFNVKFTAREMLVWDNVGDIVKSIQSKL